VAERFRRWSAADSTPASWRGPRPAAGKPKGKMVPKHPIAPSDKEISANPRSRSARLRVFEFFEEGQCQ
jgi:16S rRNA (cytosine1402-N4)-methyltransferase